MKRLLYLILLVLLSSCTTNYYAMYMVEDATIMASSSYGSVVRTVVPQGTQVYISTLDTSKYSKVKWKKYKGLISANTYVIRDFEKQDLQRLYVKSNEEISANIEENMIEVPVEGRT